jgi:antitoxin ChpS
MHTTTLREIDGSVMLAVPPALLNELHLAAGAKICLTVDNGHLVVEPQAPHYTLDELLTQCGDSFEITIEEQEWMDAKPVGKEVW